MRAIIRTNRLISHGLAFAVLLAITPVFSQLYGQSCSFNPNPCSLTLSGSVTLSVGRFTNMTVGSTSLQLNSASSAVRSADYQTGFVNSNPVAMTIWSTAPWSLKAYGVSNTSKAIGDFSFAGTASNACPSAAAYLTLSATATTANGVPGVAANTPNAGQVAYLCIRTALSWTADLASPNVTPTLYFQVSSP